VVENVSGAAGATGMATQAQAAPDGYTCSPALRPRRRLLRHMRSDLPYDPIRDLAAVTLVASFPTCWW